MRTDRRTERAPATRTTLSRRAFLAGSGGVAGPAIVGVAGAGDESVLEDVDVAATAPYRDAVRRSLETDSGSVRPETAFGDEAAVLVAGRTVDATGTLRGVVADASAVLDHSGGEWREPLPRWAIREQWASKAPVETWSESPVSPDDPRSVSGATASKSSSGQVLIRGPRAFQYADGRGGVGYYDVGSSAVLSTDSTGEDATYLVRVAYVHVDDALDDATASAFVDRYRDRVGDVADVTSQFLDPIVDG